MIVCPYNESFLVLVLQTDHSRIAGLLAAHWGNDKFASLNPYASMVLAAQEHDSGWWDWEIKPTLNEQGSPSDYIGSIKHLGQGVWLDLYRRADYTGDPAVQEFIAAQKALRPQWLQVLQKNPALQEATNDTHLWTNFKLMEVFDQFAQFVCNRYPFNSQARKNGPSNTLSNIPVPVAPGHDDVTLTLDIQNEREAVVRPFPFDVSPLVVSFQGRLVPNRRYLNQEEFLQDFYRAERIDINYTLRAA